MKPILSSAAISTAEPTFLEWDSQFFGRKIGKLSITHTSADTLALMLKTARQQHYDLLYAFADVSVSLPHSALQTHNGQFVDHKIIYEQFLTNVATTTSPSIRLVTTNDVNGGLYDLAYQSGEYSRFRIDPAIGEADFQRLYRQWVDSSISGAVADAVFVWVTDGLITGFITVEKKGDTGIIGLIASDTQHRGRGTGTALLNHVKVYAAESGLTRLEVATQGRNRLACRFYEKNGFTVKSETNVYHFWL